MLKRWSALNDGPMPADWAAFRRDTPTAAMEIEAADPELVSLLNGAAPAALRLAALTGELSDSIPSPQERQAADRQGQITKLLEASDGNPYGSAGYYNDAGEFVPGRPGNMSAAVQLEILDPQMAAVLKAQAMPAAPATGMNAEQVAFVQAEANRIRQESLQQSIDFAEI